MIDNWIPDYIIRINKFKPSIEMPLSILDNGLCPVHNKKLLPDDDQPEHGTHMFTIIYECECTIDVPLTGDSVLYNEYKQ